MKFSIRNFFSKFKSAVFLDLFTLKKYLKVQSCKLKKPLINDCLHVSKVS